VTARAQRQQRNAALWLALACLICVSVASAQDAAPSADNEHIAPPPPAQPMPDMAQGSMADVMQMHDDAAVSMFKLDQFEHALDGNGGTAWEGEAWYGGDFDKLWLRSEGDRAEGFSQGRIEAFWDHAFASFWDWQLGVRDDFGSGPSRTWAAFGVQGLAPYWVQVEATAYLGDQGRSALRLRAEYEFLLTQCLILQPEAEMNLYGQNDPRREVGAGLSDADFGLRLRYEIWREVAPYVGVVWTRRFGAAADFARAAGHDAQGTQLVAGLRVWF
jgi:copper resistance protein B